MYQLINLISLLSITISTADDTTYAYYPDFELEYKKSFIPYIPSIEKYNINLNFPLNNKYLTELRYIEYKNMIKTLITVITSDIIENAINGKDEYYRTLEIKDINRWIAETNPPYVERIESDVIKILYYLFSEATIEYEKNETTVGLRIKWA